MPEPGNASVESHAVIARWSASARRSVLFDFNGTLCDDEPLLLGIYTEMFREHLGWTLTARDYYGQFAGLSDREILTVALRELASGDSMLDRLLLDRQERYCALVEQRSPIASASLDLVHALREQDVRLGIVTGAQRHDVAFVLSHSSIADSFEVIVTDEDVTKGKPDPEGYRSGAAGLDLDPQSILVFEDSVYGVRAARAAGMACIAVVGTRSREILQAEADAVIDRLEPAVLAAPLAGSAAQTDS